VSITRLLTMVKLIFLVAVMQLLINLMNHMWP
jgi:hypothetical protein